mgnify:CR=1 FL=1
MKRRRDPALRRARRERERKRKRGKKERKNFYERKSLLNRFAETNEEFSGSEKIEFQGNRPPRQKL